MRNHGRNGFTMIDIMIVIVVIAILAAIVLPLVSHYIDNAEVAAADSNLSSALKAVEMYRLDHGSYPPTLDALEWQTDETLEMPPGYALDYDPVTGQVTLVTP